MPIEIVCAQCSREYRVADKLIGKKIRCKDCGAAIKVAGAVEGGFSKQPLKAVGGVRSSGAAPKKAAPAPEALDLPPEPDLSDLPMEVNENLVPREYVDPPCPGCGRPLPASSKVCMLCGYNRSSGKRARTVVGGKVKAALNFAGGGGSALKVAIRFWWLWMYAAALMSCLAGYGMGIVGSLAVHLLLLCVASGFAIVAYGWWLWVIYPREYVSFLIWMFIPFAGLFMSVSKTIEEWGTLQRPLKLWGHAFILGGMALGLSYATRHADGVHAIGSPTMVVTNWSMPPMNAVPASPSLERAPITPAPTINPDLPAQPVEMTSEYAMFEIRMATGGQSLEQMVLHLYLPRVRRGRVPCVFIAPAGTPCIWGNELGSGDRAEHVPYVRAGFVVAAYSLDGPSTGPKGIFSREARAVSAFAAAEGGVQNCRRAIDYVLAKVPIVDPNMLVVAGHSSAGTVALDAAAADSRIRAVAAYCPCVDIEDHLRGSLPKIERHLPGITDFVHKVSPINIDPARFGCPIFLLNASQDTNVAPATLDAFAQRCQAGNVRLTRGTGVGDHYNGMIAGIPQGISFFEKELNFTPPRMAMPVRRP